MTTLHRILFLLLAGVMAMVGCAKEKAPELRRMVPSLSEDMSRHLVEDSPASFKKFAQTAGLDATSRAYSLVFMAPRTDSLAWFGKDEAQLAPYLDKLTRALNDEFSMGMAEKRQEAYLRRSLSERREIVCIKRDVWALVYNDTIPVQEKADAYLRLIERSLPYSDAFGLGDMYATYASFLPRGETMSHYLDLGVTAAIEVGDLETASQILGTLGMVQGSTGNRVEMRKTWDRGLELARKANSPQECRILSFYAMSYLRDGRLALSRDLASRAQDRCRELGATRMEIRFLIEGLNLFWLLECWPVLEKNLQRADVLLREGKSAWTPVEERTWRMAVNRYRALYFAGTGSCAEAESVVTELMSEIASDPPSIESLSARLEASLCLRECDQPNEALPIVEDALTLSREHGIPFFLPNLDLELASIQFSLRNYTESRRALELFEKDQGASTRDLAGRGWGRHNEIETRLDMASGDSISARRHIAEALYHMQKQRRGMDASPEASLAVSAAASLQDLAHQLLDTSPETGYARELVWRMLQAGIWESDGPPTNAALTRMAREALKQLNRHGAVHCVYRVQDDRVLRWTAYDGTIIHDEIHITAKELESRVLNLRAAVLSGGIVRTGERQDLSTVLLPSIILSQEGPRRLFITPDGPLTQLPFEALNMSAATYEPLLHRADVAYLLYDRLDKKTSSGAVICVSNPAYPSELKRRYSILTEALPDGMQEALSFAKSFPNATSLQGASATKAQLTKSWAGAEAIYFACHTVQDPEIPYITFIPLASSNLGSDENAYLDLLDLHSADLSRCQLVVLSSCGTGASYLSGRLSAPSLAEAFVQAGARAVISTSWSVKDDEAARVMRLFASRYNPSAKDPVSALNAARRELLEQGAPPRIWASYSIMLGGF